MTVLSWPCQADARVLAVEGSLRAPVSTALRHGVRALVRRGERHIVADLSRVSRIDAAGVGELVRAYNMARVAKGTFHVVKPSAWVREVMARVGLLDVLTPKAATSGAVQATAFRHADTSYLTSVRHKLPAPCEQFRFPRS